MKCGFLSSISSLSPSLRQVGPSSGAGKANGHISLWLVPLRRLGGCEVIPSLLFPFTSGIYHFITAVMEDGEWRRHPSFPPSIHPSIRSRF